MLVSKRENEMEGNNLRLGNFFFSVQGTVEKKEVKCVMRKETGLKCAKKREKRGKQKDT